ncbi:hypothetical protein IEQ34_015521 [Dendrobium chrysotoxum]|uniref:Disease resistance protein n=1 Tax=Dendrobium chrysotoxum TaxID=161865 RepID=A0AAV7G0W7_DENCH|nr:hypothetical protein IEQ34_015521 [Dendrobium chrysotoxum]
MMPLRCVNSIQKLKIKDNDELVSFPIDAEQWFLQVSSSLGELDFKRLKSLRSLPSSLTNLSSLKVLSVRKVSQLQVWRAEPQGSHQLVSEPLDEHRDGRD